MNPRRNSRRDFLRTSAAAVGAASFVPYVFTAHAEDAARPKAKNDRPRFAAIGLRYQGSVLARHAPAYGDLVALCDVDANILATAKAAFGSTAATHEDYRKILDRKDVDAVLIGAPDHWHAPMLIDACRARQRCVLRKAPHAHHRRRQADSSRRLQDKKCRAGRLMAAERRTFSPRGRDGPRRTPRQNPQNHRRPGQEQARRAVRSRRDLMRRSIGTCGKARRPTFHTSPNGRTIRFAGGTNTPAG